MSAPFWRHNFTVGQALARHGVKYGGIPAFAPEIIPTIQLADVAQAYSGEPLEARGLAGGATTGFVPAGFRGLIRLEVTNSPGGIVVESWLPTFSGFFGSDGFFIDILTAPVPGAVEVERIVLQTGGAIQRANSRVFDGWTDQPVSGAGPFFPIYAFASTVETTQRIFVPSGAHLVAFSQVNSNGGGQVANKIIWREIPTPIGLP